MSAGAMKPPIMVFSMLIFWLCAMPASGLSMMQRGRDHPQTVVKTGVGLIVAKAESTNLEAKQSHLEQLVRAEQTALSSQQKALEAIAKQEKEFRQMQAVLREEEKQIEAEAARRHIVGRGFSLTQFSYRSVSSLQELKRNISHKMLFKEQLVAATCYIILMFMAGWVYGLYFTYPYKQLRTEPVVTGQNFTFKLLDGFKFDPDFRIPVFGLICIPVRWADTASSPKIGFMRFWPALIAYTSLAAFSGISHGVTWILGLILAVLNRSKIRHVYGLPVDANTCIEDTAIWACCCPCATMQEALEVEFIDPPNRAGARPTQQHMTVVHGPKKEIEAVGGAEPLLPAAAPPADPPPAAAAGNPAVRKQFGTPCC